MDDDFRISRLMRLFAKNGGTESETVKQFRNLSDEVRRELTENGQLSEAERPFLTYYVNPSRWTVLTLLRFVWRHDGRIRAMPISSLTYPWLSEDDVALLSAAAVEATERLDRGLPPPPPAITSLKNLQLVTRDGDKAVVEFGIGGQLIGFWNALQMLIKQVERKTGEI